MRPCAAVARPLVRCLLLAAPALLLSGASASEAAQEEESSGADAEDGGRGQERRRIAVIGGGIAGSATVLELLHYDVDVTLFEQAARIGHNQSASGIIAALTIFDTQQEFFHTLDSPDKVFELIQQESSLFRFHWAGLRVLQFGNQMLLNKVSGDVRSKCDYKHGFNNASRKALEDQLDNFPILCSAIRGPYCCREAPSPAREWMDRNNRSCNDEEGILHTWVTEKGWSVANDNKSATAHGWEFNERTRDAEQFLNETGRVRGVLWDSRDEGFVQVEELYPILTEIFENSSKVTLAVDCKVLSLKQSPGGRLEVVAPNCSAAGIYDSVIVAGGANSVNIIGDQDALIWSDLLPIKGYAIGTDQPLIDEALRRVGVLIEDLGHYVRPRVQGGVAYGFGKEVGTWEDQLLAPKYEPWGVQGPEATALGQTILDQPHVEKLAGIRPLSAWNAHPLLKRYDGPWRGLVLNTGYGFYGYTLAWKSAQLAAEMAVLGNISDPVFAHSVETYTGCGPVPCWMYHIYLFAQGCFYVVLLVLVSICCCVGEKVRRLQKLASDCPCQWDPRSRTTDVPLDSIESAHSADPLLPN